MEGGAGGDELYGGAGNDTIYGGSKDSPNDTSRNSLTGGAGNDELYAGAGGDALDGGAGSDKLYGGAGNDELNGGANGDQMDGGGGGDTYYVDATGDSITDSAGYSDTVVASISYTLGAGLENLVLGEPAPPPAPGIGSGGAVMGAGNELDNIIAANSLDSRLKGLGGDDWINGGAGDDTAVYRGKESEYDVKYLDYITLVRDSNGGRDGFDVLIGVEHLEFAPEDDEPEKTPPQPFRGFAPLFIDPLVLDLDGDGVKLIPLEWSQTHFDFDGNNFRSRHRQPRPRQCRRRRLAGRQRHRLARQLRDEPREVA